MEIILIEPVRKLGNIGDIVTVKDGFGRNFLIPQGKAIRATKSNKEVFEARKADLEKKYQEARSKAEVVANKINNEIIELIRQASDDNRLYGSVTAKEISQIFKERDLDIKTSIIDTNGPLKTIGVHKVLVNLYGDLTATIFVNIAKSESEAHETTKDFKAELASGKTPAQAA